jgi:multicomponent Na+:H+ antiporter subunit B
VGKYEKNLLVDLDEKANNLLFDWEMNIMADLILLFFLLVCAVAAVAQKQLLNSVIILSIYSLIIAVVWVRLGAVDVAITEAAVGAGISTVLFIAVLIRVKPREDLTRTKVKVMSLFLVLAVGATLIYGTLDMPDFGSPSAVTNTHIVPRYLEKGVEETGVDNYVTAILASYRGYDTLGETMVIFTAGLCVVLLLGSGKKRL